VSPDIRDQLQSTLSGSYTLERELGGGGMSRVFVADETRLARKVVVKVLSPELAAGISAERFEREIKVAASLQQANIVPVLSAGDSAGLPYYTMPFVDGESLRARLGRGAFSIAEATSILRDVARALAYAHERGIVHRDIKPDNVLLSRGTAVVTDFGIAKALAAAQNGASGATLTQLGTALGTPAYMAPEQSAGDPATDHRADFYAFGCMAYELLTGRLPFDASTPQKLLAAHMSETARPVSELRPDTPPPLAALVTRCMAKDATNRPQTADELLDVLDSTATSDSAQPAMPAILLGGPGMLRKALIAYAVAFIVVAIVARAAIIAIGLPDWVFPGALVVMALGLPVILFTGYTQYVARRAMTTSPTLTPGGSRSVTTHGTLANIAIKASPHVSWRRTAIGGVYAVGAFMALVGVFMLLRALGIGPAGSLLGRGTIAKNGRILVADFSGPASDTSLGTVVTEAFRTGLGQSRSIVVMQAATMRDVLRRMQRPAGSRVDLALAREIATREGIKVVVDGEIIGVGGKYALSARLIETQSGEQLAAYSARANDAGEVLPAIDRITKGLRERIGESFKTIRDASPLERVTTPSLEALRKYVQGVNALSFDGDFNKGVALLEEAIALDTGFAMAYRKLAIELNNRGGQPARVKALLTKAFEHADRLSDPERYLMLGAYYQFGPQPDNAKAIAAYESLIDLQPENATALNNVSILYQWARDYGKAEAVLLRAARTDQPPAVVLNNTGYVSIALGKRARAESTAAAMGQQYPNNSFAMLARAQLLYSLGHADSSVAILERINRASASDLTGVAGSSQTLSALALVRGHVNEARRWNDVRFSAQTRRDGPVTSLEAALEEAWLTAWLLDDKPRAQRTIDQAVSRQPLDSISIYARPYALMVATYATLGRIDRAKAVLASFDRARAERALGQRDETDEHVMRGDIAVAEAKYADAQREYRQADVGQCRVCTLPRLAHAYDLAGEADSARAIFSRYVDTPDAFRLGLGNRWRGSDADFLAGTYKRLGELWEQAGDRQKAATYYAKFIELWKDADPELQPKVAEVRKRLARLSETETKR